MSSAASSVDETVEETTSKLSRKLKDGSGLAFPKEVERASLRELPTSVGEQDQVDSAAKLE